MEDLRIGVIGFGLRRSIALHAHRPGEGARIVAVVDPAERARREVAEQIDAECAVHASLDEFLALDLDAVMVLSPDHTHAEITQRTLSVGLPTFCEKPLAISLEDADAILGAAHTHRTKLYVGHNMRHMPVVRQMKSLIDSGAIGKVRSVWCRHFVGAGGDFYLEDISLLNLRLDNGVLATYQQCHFTPDYWRNYTVIGDAGRLENIGDSGGDQIHLWTSRRSGARTPDRVEVIERGDGGHGGADPSLVAEFLRFVREGGPTEVSTVAARQAVAAACLGAESIRSDGAPRRVPELAPELVAYFDRWQA